MARAPLSRAAACALFGVCLIGGTACSSDTGDLDSGVTDVPDGGLPPVWTPEPGVPTREDFFAIWGRSRDDIFAVGWGGTIVHWDGVAWTLETVTTTVTLTDVHGWVRDDGMPPEPTDPVFAVGWGGTILQRGPDRVWTQVPVLDTRGMVTSTLTQDLFGVFVGAEDSALVVGAGGKILGWDGTDWNTVRFTVPGQFTGLPIEPLGVLKGVWSGNGSTYYISGSGGAAYRSSGGYQAFEALDTRVNEPLRGVWGVRGGPVFTVGLEGLILRFDGEWRRITNNGASELPTAFFFDIEGTGGTDDLTVVGWRGTAARFRGGQWYVEETGTPFDLRSLWIDQTTEVAFAVGATGTVIRRDPPELEDAGVTD